MDKLATGSALLARIPLTTEVLISLQLTVFMILIVLIFVYFYTKK